METLEAAERAIFETKVNGVDRCYDPWTVYSTLYFANDIVGLHERSNSDALENAERLAAQDEFLSVIRQAFDVKSIEEAGKDGLTKEECADLFEQFIVFLEDFKKKQPTLLSKLVLTDYSGLVEKLQQELDSSLQSSESESSTINPTNT